LFSIEPYLHAFLLLSLCSLCSFFAIELVEKPCYSDEMEPTYQRLWASQVLIGLVLIWNVQCAVAFLVFPDQYTSGFALDGVVGGGMVRAIGILFLMWNVPYAVAASHPHRRRVSLYEAIAMQTIALVGESLLLASFPAEPAIIRVTVGRFILFDGIGLAALLLAALLINKPRSEPNSVLSAQNAGGSRARRN
jgi:hypothetical protein